MGVTTVSIRAETGRRTTTASAMPSLTIRWALAPRRGKRADRSSTGPQQSARPRTQLLHHRTRWTHRGAGLSRVGRRSHGATNVHRSPGVDEARPPLHRADDDNSDALLNLFSGYGE